MTGVRPEANPNRAIYNENYTGDELIIDPATPYDRAIIDYRLSLLERFAPGKEVLDLCCGTGAYLIPLLGRVKAAVGVDFSRRMLERFRERLGDGPPGRVALVEADARRIPLRGESVDFLFSFTALYHVPGVGEVLREVRRVLRRGGRAALEMGNLHSLNTLVCREHHRRDGWAKPYHLSYRAMVGKLAAAGLEVREWKAFQILPMYGAPRRLRFLAPLLTPRWKSLLGISLGGRMLDERVSSSWPLRHLSFRHFFLVERP